MSRPDLIYGRIERPSDIRDVWHHRIATSNARAVVFKLSLKNKVSLTFEKITRVLSDTRVPGYRQGTGVTDIETGTRLLGYLFRALITYVTTLLMLHVQLQVGNCAKQTGIIFF